MSYKVLIHVEDPGAANWILPLLPVLETQGVAVKLVAEGTAIEYLRARGVSCLVSEANEEADFVLVGTSENLESRALSLINVARARGVPCAAVVDQTANAEHRFRGVTTDPLRNFPDWVFVPDARAAERFVGLGAAKERCVVVGNPHHDRVLAQGSALASEGRVALRRRLFPRAQETERIIVFVSEIGYVVNEEADIWQAANGFIGRGATRYRTAVILEEVLDACDAIEPRPFVVLRLHPKNRIEEFAAYENELNAVSAGGDPLAVVYVADLVVGMTSALLEDAALLGRPTLAVLPRPEERDWLAMVADGRIPHALSREELRAALPALPQAGGERIAATAVGAAERIANFIVARSDRS